mmetsp:Transcript_11146/g.21922  ORF Transcript_11146/g.21922 Transcript_11146/m.21922 type:complete len:817 (+) Transcript_11146:67-2517(+)
MLPEFSPARRRLSASPHKSPLSITQKTKLPQLPSLYAVADDYLPCSPMTPSKSPVKVITDAELPASKRYKTKGRQTSKQFRSPFIYTTMKFEETTARSETMRATAFPVKPSVSTNETYDNEVLQYLESSHLSPIKDQSPCPICGMSFGDFDVLEQLKSNKVDVVRDLQFSLKCIDMLQTLSFEMTQDSRTLHYKLLHQLQFAIFPEETPGVYSRASYFSIYEQLSKERSDLQEALATALTESQGKTEEINKLKRDIEELKVSMELQTKKIGKLEKTNSRLKVDNEQLLEKYMKIRDSGTELQNQIIVLTSELKLKDQAVQCAERAFHSQADSLMYRIQEIKAETPKPVVKEEHETYVPVDYLRLNSLEGELTQLKRSKEHQEKLYRVMRKCYEADMKSFKEYMNTKMFEQKIDQGPKTRNYLQRVKMDVTHYKELSRLTGQNVNDMSFDEVVKLTTDVVSESKGEVEKYKRRYDELEKMYLDLQLARQEVMDQIAELKTRITYTELYVEDFSLAPIKSERLFVGLGRTLEVPRFLRTNGFVNNLNLTKRDVLSVINELWTMKQQWQNKVKRQMPLPIFLYNFLRNKFNYQPKVIEFGYNLMETSERYSDEPDLEIFLLIIKNEFPEQLFYDCSRMVKLLKRYLIEVASRYKADAVPSLTKPTIVKCIQNFFPDKRPKDLEILTDMLDRESAITGKPGEAFPIDMLFDEENVEQMSTFVQCIKKQYLMDIQRFYADLSSMLLKTGDKANSAISVMQLKQIYSQVDGSLTPDQAAVRLAPLLGSYIGEDKALVSIPSAVMKMKRLFMKPSQLYLSTGD